MRVSLSRLAIQNGAAQMDILFFANATSQEIFVACDYSCMFVVAGEVVKLIEFEHQATAAFGAAAKA